MTLGIPLSAFVIETSEEPAVINSDGLCVIQLAYKRTDQPEYDEYDEDNGDAEWFININIYIYPYIYKNIHIYLNN